MVMGAIRDEPVHNEIDLQLREKAALAEFFGHSDADRVVTHGENSVFERPVAGFWVEEHEHRRWLIGLALVNRLSPSLLAVV